MPGRPCWRAAALTTVRRAAPRPGPEQTDASEPDRPPSLTGNGTVHANANPRVLGLVGPALRPERLPPGAFPGAVSGSGESSGAADEPAPGLASRGLVSFGCDTLNEGLISLTQFPCL